MKFSMIIYNHFNLEHDHRKQKKNESLPLQHLAGRRVIFQRFQRRLKTVH